MANNLAENELLERLEQAHQIIRGLVEERLAGVGTDYEHGDYCVYCGEGSTYANNYQIVHRNDCEIAQGRLWLGWNITSAISTLERTTR